MDEDVRPLQHLAGEFLGVDSSHDEMCRMIICAFCFNSRGKEEGTESAPRVVPQNKS